MNDGGPAFPVVFNGNTVAKEGMTLRDWFAGQAPPMPDWFADHDTNDYTEQFYAWPYHYADAMLKAREVQDES